MTGDDEDDMKPAAKPGNNNDHKRKRSDNDDDSSSYSKRHIRDKEAVPTTQDNSSAKTTFLRDKTAGLESFNKLIEDAKGIRERKEGKGRFAGAQACSGDTNSTEPEKHVEVLGVGHFPPPKEEPHEYGTLSTWADDVDEEGVATRKSLNCLPLNSSIHTFFSLMAIILAIQYDINPEVANSICMEISAWIDILPIILPATAADKDKKKNKFGRENYVNIRNKTDEHSMQYILDIIKQLPNLKYIIVLGEEAWLFMQKMEKKNLLGDIKIIQHSALPHPTRILKHGVTQREAYWFYECINELFACLIGQPPKPFSRKTALNIFGNRNNGDTSGCYIYKGWYDGSLLFIARSLKDLRTMVINAGGSIREHTQEELEAEEKKWPTVTAMSKESGKTFVYRGLEIEQIWFLNHDYKDEKFGKKDSPKLEAWRAHAKKCKVISLLNRYDSERSVTATQAAKTISSVDWDD